MPPNKRNNQRRRPPSDTRKRKRVVHKFGEDEVVDYKDVALLRKFMSDRGKIRARRVTGLSPSRQREVAKAIKNAREMGLLPYVQIRS
ncbi:MAG TPA: 30S ribosomal protein S18 [Acidimicrobiia bacterium]|jgi:small subunit ribosomal protein S18|nr:30S ribosomal protein S18 [Acidimicrobiia bacterium]